MGIRTWRKIGHALLAAGLGLLVAGAVFRTYWCIWAGTVVLFVALVVDIAFLKCPKCGKYLIRKGDKIKCSDKNCNYSVDVPKEQSPAQDGGDV